MILLAWILSTSAPAYSPTERFPAYDSVLVYNFGLRSPPVRSIFNPDSTLHKTTVLPGKKLSSRQTIQLLDKLNDKRTYGGAPMACFEPRHAVVFYHKGKIPALIEICFVCNNMRSYPEIAAQNYYFNKKNQTIQNYGFSEKGAAWLKEFFVQAGLKLN
jgi:hypothetical protein